MMRSFLYATLLAALGAGCALTSKGVPLDARYFTPEATAEPPSATATSTSAEPSVPADAAPLALRLGTVEPASYVDQRIAYRIPGSELGYYDDRRWTESPDEYLRRALERELFERRGMRRIISGPAPVLDLELTAFDELKGNSPRVRLALHYTLHDDREALLEKDLVVELPLPPDAGADHAARIAETLGHALARAVSAVAADVEHRLRAAPAPAAPASARGI